MPLGSQIIAQLIFV